MPTTTDHDTGLDAVPADRATSEALAGEVMTAAAEVARHESTFLRLLGEFDACDAVRWWDGIASSAHWVAWSCSIAPGTAREHVRVARALRRMPHTTRAFEAAELSYSKVRELTRLVDDHDEERMLELARHATASQLARTVAAYRACPGTQKKREARERVSWQSRDDGCVQISAVLTPEQGAAVVAALEAAASANLQDPPDVGDVREPNDQQETPEAATRRSRVAGLVEIAQHYLHARPEDRSGEDRTMVVVEVSASELMGVEASNATVAPAGDAVGDVPAETDDNRSSTGGDVLTDVPAGTSQPTGDGRRCAIRGFAGLEPETARRLACEAQVHAVVAGLDGEPLAVGRTLRFGTRAQRRALSVRDRQCVFPGCDRTRHLKVHHVVPWYAGGPTDLDNLMLLCQRHHTAVHEGGITIERRETCDTTADHGEPRWQFTRPDGSVIIPVIHGYDLEPVLPPLYGFDGPLTGAARARAERDREQVLDSHRKQQSELHAAQVRLAEDHGAHGAHGTQPRPAQATLFPVGGGEGFNLANCVDVLFSSRQDIPVPTAA